MLRSGCILRAACCVVDVAFTLHFRGTRCMMGFARRRRRHRQQDQHKRRSCSHARAHTHHAHRHVRHGAQHTSSVTLPASAHETARRSCLGAGCKAFDSSPARGTAQPTAPPKPTARPSRGPTCSCRSRCCRTPVPFRPRCHCASLLGLRGSLLRVSACGCAGLRICARTDSVKRVGHPSRTAGLRGR